ncbi:MAG: hypothetical protein RIS79_3839 [Verrucomicrobiota bacterium]|jgi:hypothetical protein
MSEQNESPDKMVLYQAADGTVRVECRFNNETLWLSLNEMAELFGRDKSVISKHLKNIFEEGELVRDSVVANYATTAADGKSYDVDFYSLEAIFAVGYRVRSPRGIQFRQWATALLKEYAVTGYAMDDERLKQPGSSVYFERLLTRIRDIRSSEKVFWRKICDIFATSIDYDGKAETSQEFFAQVQNKMHWAAHGQTAAEVIHARADARQPNMGVQHFIGTGPTSADIVVAKNYLSAAELDMLNSIVMAYLEFAEVQAKRGRLMKMKDWALKLDDFLKAGDHELLAHAGKISAEQAKAKAELEYDRYRRVLDAQPSAVDKDFEEVVKKLPGGKKQ